MHTFLNVPLLDINRTYQMFAQPITKCSYSEEVGDTEHYSASIGYVSDATMNYSNISNGF